MNPPPFRLSIESELPLIFSRTKSSLCRTPLAMLLLGEDDGDSLRPPLPGRKATGPSFSIAEALP